MGVDLYLSGWNCGYYVLEWIINYIKYIFLNQHTLKNYRFNNQYTLEGIEICSPSNESKNNNINCLFGVLSEISYYKKIEISWSGVRDAENDGAVQTKCFGILSSPELFSGVLFHYTWTKIYPRHYAPWKKKRFYLIFFRPNPTVNYRFWNWQYNKYTLYRMFRNYGTRRLIL